jgi:hypothetical protein
VNGRVNGRQAGRAPGSGSAEATRDRSWLREGLILLAFVLLTAAGVATVVVPQLGEQPGGDAGSGEQARVDPRTEPD